MNQRYLFFDGFSIFTLKVFSATFHVMSSPEWFFGPKPTNGSCGSAPCCFLRSLFSPDVIGLAEVSCQWMFNNNMMSKIRWYDLLGFGWWCNPDFKMAITKGHRLWPLPIPTPVWNLNQLNWQFVITYSHNIRRGDFPRAQSLCHWVRSASNWFYYTFK